MDRITLKDVYFKLFAEFGPQNWWPTSRNGDLPEYLGGPIDDNERFEVMVGAILTQNTSWKNVEKAIINLGKAKALTPRKLSNLDPEVLSEMIRPAGYYNQKAIKLKEISRFILKNSLKKLKDMELADLRKKLLTIFGVGPETADSIILYALNKPIPVVDAYTKRIFSRIGLLDEKNDYQSFQEYQKENFENDSYKLQELHALLVIHAKVYCTKSNPDCWMCPLCNDCDKNY